MTRGGRGDSPLQGAAAAVLAGGRARRMGGAVKALLEVGGRAIVDRQLEVLRPLFQEIVAVGENAEGFAERGVRVVPDRLPGRGAPGGVCSALCEVAAPWVFCVGSDMPFLQPGAIARLAKERAEEVDAVVVERGPHLEPLFAFYSQRCRPRFEARLRQVQVSLVQLLGEVRVRRVPASAIAEVDPELRSLFNVNTAEDLVRARS